MTTQKIFSINPATEAVNMQFDAAIPVHVDAAVRKARQAFVAWRRTDITERTEPMRKLSKILDGKKNELARLAAIEMGKPVKEGVPEVEKCAFVCDYYADNAEKWLADESAKTDAQRSYIAFQPLGVVAAIMPWNFPYWQVFRCAIPATFAGNTIILKHSSTVPQIALKIAELFEQAGFPEGTFQTVLGGPPVGEKLVGLADAVSVTGSVAAGKRIMELAAQTGPKKVVLELGGSDAFVVLEDADLQKACKTAADSRLLNCGQSCIAAKRFIVLQEVAEEFIAGFVENAKAARIGDPLDPKTDVGPLANREQLVKIMEQFEDAQRKGAKVLLGGKRIGTKGFFFEPTVVTGVNRNMRVITEETFGPLAPVIVVKDEREALAAANDSEMGLGASVWTKDLERGERFARELEVGVAFVNMNVRSDPRLPFGGVKKSGVGRELGRYGLLEFTNMKAVKVFE
jgi:acyl-CoA reductase-like NAD-dependent aldehyde dehydrogenase